VGNQGVLKLVPKASKIERQPELKIATYAPDAPLIARAAGCSPLMEEIIHQFWGLSSGLAFLAVSEELQYFWQSEDYYVSQLQIASATEHRPHPVIALLRLSQSLCAALLEQVLGHRATGKEQGSEDEIGTVIWSAYESGSDFDFKRMSPLEASILSEFSKEILLCLRRQLIARLDDRAGNSGEEIHLLWTVQPYASGEPPEPGSTDRFPVGTLILSLPPEALKVPKPTQEMAPRLQDDFFYHLTLPFGFYLGSGKMALADVHQLESDDIVVLEASRIDRLFLIEPDTGERFPFSVKPDELRRRAPLSIPAMQQDQQQESLDMKTPARGQQAASRGQSLWDNLMIDVSAEFEPVQLPLKHLKQMTEGVVVEMGDLLHNKVRLQVEGKTLARGELVIVGDHFGVRVLEVVDETAESGEIQAVKPNRQEAVEPAEESPLGEEEDRHDDVENPEDSHGESEEEDLDDFLNDFDEEETSG
jgi:flagellar motor switch protein FliN/FliY